MTIKFGKTQNAFSLVLSTIRDVRSSSYNSLEVRDGKNVECAGKVAKYPQKFYSYKSTNRLEMRKFKIGQQSSVRINIKDGANVSEL